MVYYFRYCEGLISPPSGALTLGLSFHSSIAHNYRQKKESREDLPVSDVLDKFSTEFDHRKHETVWVEDEKPGVVKDRGIGLLREYQRVVAPPTQPKQVEMEFTIDFDNKDFTFLGYLDLVDDKNTIVETKTTSRRPSKPKPDHLLQTTAYATGFRANEGESEKGVRLDYAVSNGKAEIISFDRHVTGEEIGFFLTLVGRVAHAIESEVWIPNRANFLCSEKWCGYWNICHGKCGG